MKRIAFILLAAAGVAHAATGGVEGTVLDQTGKVATGVTIDIACAGVHKSARVDGSGHFSISGLPEGSCTLTTGGAFASTKAAVTIASGSISTIVVNVMTKEYAAQIKKQQEQARKEEERWRNEMQKRQKEMKKRPAAKMDMDGAPGVAMDRMMAPEAPMAEPMRAPAPAPRPMPKPAENKPVGGAMKPHAAGPARQQAAPAATPPAVVGHAIVAKPPVMPGKGVKLEAGMRGRGGGGGAIAAGRAMPLQEVNGWAPVRVFPVPQYEKPFEGPRTDFRETIYWNSSVETNGNGDAFVSFVTSDAVTSFRATAEGFSASGAPGGGHATFRSELPLTVDTKLPVEVTSGDTVQLPITLSNETDGALDANLTATFGRAFKVKTNPSGKIHLDAKQKRTVFVPLEVIASDGESDAKIKVTAPGFGDEVKKKIRVVPRGFPIEASAAGTAKKGEPARHVLELPGALPGSIHATLTMYPSPVAAMTQGMDAMIREPGGCFEQASSTNYPNVMIMAYLASNEAADKKLVAKTRTTLEKGYKLLTGYETPEKGYEWFGHTPGHEALTAYGLMEFADMQKVYNVDPSMVQRTANWLMSRRDNKGGFQRSSQALDSFGRAGPATTDAYIMWALSEAKRTNGMTAELAAQKKLGAETKDPYLLALAANTNLVTAPKAADTAAMVKRLAGLQGKGGIFSGAKESITMSGGESLDIETTALATLALIKASPNREYETQIRAAVDFLNTKRSGYGSWGNTQATILGLKALSAYSEYAKQMAAPGRATLIVNGKEAGTLTFDKGRRGALVWKDFGKKLQPGKNAIEVRLDSSASLPYSVAVEYRSAQPDTAPQAKVSVATQLLKTRAKMGDGVTLRAHIENKTTGGIPMTLARIGIPGGLVFQTWQLKELRDKGLIDFYETRPREVILYWRALPPSAKKDVDLNLLATVPGAYEAPASSAYLYYTAEDKAWTKPVTITIE